MAYRGIERVKGGGGASPKRQSLVQGHSLQIGVACQDTFLCHACQSLYSCVSNSYVSPVRASRANVELFPPLASQEISGNVTALSGHYERGKDRQNSFQKPGPWLIPSRHKIWRFRHQAQPASVRTARSMGCHSLCGL